MSLDTDDGARFGDYLDRIAFALETANEKRIAPDSEVLRVRVGAIESRSCYRAQPVEFVGGKRCFGSMNPRFVPVVALGEVEPGEYLVRVRPFDLLDAATWDWHDWRKL